MERKRKWCDLSGSREQLLLRFVVWRALVCGDVGPPQVSFAVGVWLRVGPSPAG